VAPEVMANAEDVIVRSAGMETWYSLSAALSGRFYECLTQG